MFYGLAVSSCSLWEFGGGGEPHKTSIWVKEKAWSCMLMNDRPSVLSQLSKHWFSIYCVPGTRSRAKDTKMITSLKELIDLQGVHSQLVLEISLRHFFRRMSRTRKRKTVWELSLIVQAKDGVLYCFPSQVFLCLTFRGIEGGRRGGHGKGEGAGKAQICKDRIILHLLVRKAAEVQKGATAVPITSWDGMLCLDSASAEKFPTTLQSLKIQNCAPKMEKNWDPHNHARN